jgi:hypothetical protein
VTGKATDVIKQPHIVQATYVMATNQTTGITKRVTGKATDVIKQRDIAQATYVVTSN